MAFGIDFKTLALLKRYVNEVSGGGGGGSQSDPIDVANAILRTPETSITIGPYEGTVIGYIVTDSVTGEEVMCDASVQTSTAGVSVTLSIAEAHTNDLNVTVCISA